MTVKIDMPLEANQGEEALLLDANAGFSIIVEQGAGYQWTERYAQLKASFQPLTIGTESTTHTNYFLVKEQNFTDAGGGFFEWDRLYANVPNTWSETQVFNFAYIVVFDGQVFNLNIPVSTKVTHSYQVGYPGQDAGEGLRKPVFSVGYVVPTTTVIRPPEVENYLGDIWETRRYTLLNTFIVGETTPT